MANEICMIRNGLLQPHRPLRIIQISFPPLHLPRAQKFGGTCRRFENSGVFLKFCVSLICCCPNE